MAENENRASPSSFAELSAFLAHLKAIDRDGNERISAAEFMADIAAHVRERDRKFIPKEYVEASDPVAAIREDIAAIKAFADLDKRWNARDLAVTEQMWGKASEAQEAAKDRLGELLGYEPQFIANVLRENVSDLAALKKDEADAAKEAKDAAREAAADKAERAQTQRELEEALPKGPARDAVKDVTEGGPQTDAEATREAIKQIPGGLPEEFGALFTDTNTATAAARVDPQIMAVRKQLAAYKSENVEAPNLGDLEKVLSNFSPQEPKGNGPNIP